MEERIENINEFRLGFREVMRSYSEISMSGVKSKEKAEGGQCTMIVQKHNGFWLKKNGTAHKFEAMCSCFRGGK